MVVELLQVGGLGGQVAIIFATICIIITTKSLLAIIVIAIVILQGVEVRLMVKGFKGGQM